jgi:hypothetical protein
VSARPGTNLVLVFGESLHDARSIEHLLIAANPALERRVAARPRPTSLTRSAGANVVRDWVDELRRTVAAYEATGRTVAAVVVHRDADRADPDAAEENRLRGQLARIGGHPAVPVQMIEAWWFLFPQAVESVRPVAWRDALPRRSRDVETITDPKAELMRVTRKRSRYAYAEADSVTIAKAVRSTGAAPLGRSASYSRFVAMARSLR